MFSVLWKVRGLCVLAAALAVGAVGCGTDPEEACDIFCTKSAECQAGVVKSECLTTCKEQVKDQAYSDALVEQSDCYQDATCADLSSNTCVPQNL